MLTNLTNRPVATYAVSFDHSACSYGAAVLIDDRGTPCGFADLGVSDLAPNACGRVDYVTADGSHAVEWSGFGDKPFRMWSALQRVLKANPHLTTVNVFDGGKFEVA